MKTCGNCWNWKEPVYSQRPGKCRLDIYDEPYENTETCEKFDSRDEEDETK